MKQNNWFDPFFILENLSAEEKLIQKNVRDFSNNVLRPIVVNENRNHNFNRGLYREFGKLGILGSTVKNHGGAGASGPQPHICKVSDSKPEGGVWPLL